MIFIPTTSPIRHKKYRATTVCNTNPKPICCNKQSKTIKYSYLFEVHSASSCCIKLLQNILRINSSVMMDVHHCNSTQTFVIVFHSYVFKWRSLCCCNVNANSTNAGRLSVRTAALYKIFAAMACLLSIFKSL